MLLNGSLKLQRDARLLMFTVHYVGKANFSTVSQPGDNKMFIFSFFNG